MSGGRRNGSGEDSPAAVLPTGAASRDAASRGAGVASGGVAAVSGGQIRGETANSSPRADIGLDDTEKSLPTTGARRECE